jgi:hypothetical protein
MARPCASALESRAISVGATALQRQLETSSYSSLRRLSCSVVAGRIVLRGTVPCYYLKQVAQTLAVKTVGWERIDSDIEVHAG